VKSAGEFKLNPNNWREHPDTQQEAIRSILQRVGWVQGVIENVTTGNLIDGHARVSEAKKRNASTPIPFVKVDLTEDEEKQILLLLDPIGAMATGNEAAIKALMDSLDIQESEFLAALGNFTEIIPDFEPAALDEQGILDKLNMIVCPNCNHEFAR